MACRAEAEWGPSRFGARRWLVVARGGGGVACTRTGCSLYLSLVLAATACDAASPTDAEEADD